MSLALLILLIGASPALGASLAAFTDHTGEDHSFENHQGAYLEGIVLADADLTGTVFKNAFLGSSVLTSAMLVATDLTNADFTGADLTDASMWGADARNADFTNATLDGASFVTGDVRNAIFVGASLRGTDLSALTNANRADFTGATYDLSTRLAPGMDTSGMTLVPEPSTGVLLLVGLVGLEAYSRRVSRRVSRGVVAAAC